MHNTMFADLNKRRSSARAFSLQQVEEHVIVELFESVRWAQSSFNDQPWQFLIATPQDEARAELQACLGPGNEFAGQGWILGCVYARTTFAVNGQSNAHALFDCGAACQVLALQACDLGLSARFIAGFDAARAGCLSSPELSPVVMFVVGYPAAPKKPSRPRERKPLQEVFTRRIWQPT